MHISQVNADLDRYCMHDELEVPRDIGLSPIVAWMLLTWRGGYRLAVVHLVDAHLCTDGSKYMSALLLSLTSMLHLEMPHVNVLSKMDMIQSYGPLAFNLDFYTEVEVQL